MKKEKVLRCTSVSISDSRFTPPPPQKPLLHTVLGKASQHRYNLVYSSVTDQFELCLTKCRTSSLSVLQQNV